MRRMLALLAVTVAAVVALATYRTHSPAPARTRASAHAPPPPRRYPPGTRAANGLAISSAYTTIQVRAFVYRGRLIDVQEVEVENDNTHSKDLNDGAIPVLHEEALKAGSAHIHVVSGATGTSASYASSLQSAINRARG
jgi:uncharacterized protein with FMN-binding domain